MSRVYSESARNTDVNLVEQILEQGQRLRNAMVQTILNNDPFNKDIINNKSLKCSFGDTVAINAINSENCGDNLTKTSLPTEEKHKFLAYLRGEQMSKHDERQVLETFRAMSNSEIYDATERSASSDYSCNCDTCKAYYKHNLSCDFNHSTSRLCNNRSNMPPLDLHRFQKESFKVKENGGRNNSPSEYLKYVDSLKISVHNLLLNQEGNKKVCGSILDKRIKLPTSISHTYFIEYNVPDVLTKQNVKTKSKVDSGLDCPNLVRMCSKKLQNEAVYFKQISLHEVVHLHLLDLSAISIKFCVTCRTLKQKNSNLLGYATFNMNSFLETKYLSSNQDLLLMLNNEAPIILGTLKVSLQLGCEQLYFGKEFIDAIQANKENICNKYETIEEDVTSPLVNPHHNSQASLVSHCRENEFADTNYEIINKKVINDFNKPCERIDCEKQPLNSNVVDTKVLPKQTKLKIQNVNVQDNTDHKHKNQSADIVQQLDYNKEVLFGFVYLSEAQYFCDIENTFATCQPFCQDDVLYTKLIYCNSKPVYNFHQITPFVYDDDFLNKLRDNYMIVEFWEKFESHESIIGLCKIPLHQFFVAFRNPIIVKYLARNKLPVIGCDGWETICDPVNGQVYGEVQILVALGSEEQIKNLEVERGFKSEIVIAKSTHTLLNTESARKAANSHRLKNIEQRAKGTRVFYKKQTHAENNKLTEVPTSGKRHTKTPRVNLKTVDIGVQSNLEMGEESKGNDQQRPLGQDLLGSFLAQLVEQKHKNISVENSTNTENAQCIDGADTNNTSRKVTVTFNHNDKFNPNVRKTSDLLDSLQKAFLTEPSNKVENAFKARIGISNALHLPSRKKYKCKKSRGKNTKPEEVLPSTYVTFETLPGVEVNSTKVVQKTKNPEWDYECDVTLPVELLTDTQKRLIFKVWKKSNSTSLQPNVHTDTVLGFAGLDLTVLLAGLPIMSGWFNIIDVSSKCNGQIKINVMPLENLSKFYKHTLNEPATPIQSREFELGTIVPEEEKIEVGKAEQGEFLSRALKRKFTELDEITQRLRLRLSRVTNDESDTSNDGFVDEFERDINTLCVEDDYDTVNFEDGSKFNTQDASTALLQIQNCNFIYKDPVTSELSLLVDNVDAIGCNLESNENILSLSNKISNSSDNKLSSDECSSSSVSTVAKDLSAPTTTDLGQLDKQLLAGKQRIDTLLQKLSLFTHNDTETFSSRYISGCSSKQNDEVHSGNVLHDLKIDGDVDHDFIVNPTLFHNLHSDSVDTTPLLLSQRTDAHLVCSTSSSLVTQFSECRPSPDGAGNISHDKNMNTSSSST